MGSKLLSENYAGVKGVKNVGKCMNSALLGE